MVGFEYEYAGDNTDEWADLGYTDEAPVMTTLAGRSVTIPFTTKDSGQRAEFASGMVRDTQAGKPRWDLTLADGVPYEHQLLTRFAGLMARGAEKYDERNWEQANSQEELDRMKGSALRHLMQWFCGEQDEDHAAACLFNLMAYEATAYKMAQDPRR